MLFNSIRLWIVIILALAFVVWHFYTKVVKNEEDDLRNLERMRKI